MRHITAKVILTLLFSQVVTLQSFGTKPEKVMIDCRAPHSKYLSSCKSQSENISGLIK